jgi:hypothetical protein
MGKTSLFQGSTPHRRVVAADAITGPGQVIVMQLGKENFQKDHQLVFNLAMANVGAATAVDNDLIGKLVASVVLSVASPHQQGELINCSGLMATMLSATQDEDSFSIGALAAPQLVQFAIDLHHVNDAALRDMMTALDGDAATGITLTITMGALADARSIAGGPYVAAAAFTTLTGTVEVVVTEYPTAALANVAGVGTGRHFIREIFAAVAGVGVTTLDLRVGNRCRGLLISTETAAGVPIDTIITNLSLMIKGVSVLNHSWFAARLDSANECSVDGVGHAWIAFSDDDEKGFLDLYNTNQAQLVCTTGAAGQIRLLQDYSEALG